MAYVTVPKDLTKIKSKVMFNLTKRQLICFSAAVAIGLPLFFLVKGSVGTSAAALCMVLAMLPMFLLAMYEKNGQPLEVISFCELIMGGKNGLEAVEKTLIDRAVISVYRNYLADPKPENMPILGDLYDEIKKQPEKEAQRIAAALELYVNGSLNIFNHRTFDCSGWNTSVFCLDFLFYLSKQICF